MRKPLGSVMDKKDFMSDGIFDKEPYEGLLISARSDGKLTSDPADPGYRSQG